MVRTDIECPNCKSIFDVKDIKRAIKEAILKKLEFKIEEILKEI